MSYSGIRNAPLSRSRERGIPAEVFLPRAKKRKEYVLNRKQFVGIGASILLSGLISAGIVKALMVFTPMACKLISIAANNVLRSQSTTDVDKRNQERIAPTLRRNMESSQFIEAFFGVSPVLISSFNDDAKRHQMLQTLSDTYANETVTLRLATDFLRDYELEIDGKGSTATRTPASTRNEKVSPHVKLQKLFSHLVKRRSESLGDDKPDVQTIKLSEFRSGANISLPNSSFYWYMPSDIRILVLDDHALRSMPLVSEILQAPGHSITRDRAVIERTGSNKNRDGDGAEHKDINIIGSEDEHVPQRYLDNSFFGPVSLSIDRAESGMPFHQGRHCWVDLLSGSRRWLMFPPGKLPEPGFNPYAPTSDWLRDREAYRAITPTIDDTLIEAWQQPGQVLYIPEGWYRASITTTEESIGMYQCANKLDQGSFFETLQEGWQQLRSGDFGAAQKLFRRALMNRDDPFVRYSLGVSQDLGGDFAAAEASYRSAIEGNKLDPRPYERLVHLILRQQQQTTTTTTSPNTRGTTTAAAATVVGSDKVSTDAPTNSATSPVVAEVTVDGDFASAGEGGFALLNRAQQVYELARRRGVRSTRLEDLRRKLFSS